MCEIWSDSWTQQYLKQYENDCKSMWPKLAKFLANIPRDYSERRARLEKLVSLVEPSTRQRLIKKLRSKVDFHATVRELKAISDLLLRGIHLEYEPNFYGQTPDWAALDGNGDRSAVIEVTTCTTSEAETSFCRLWNCLNEASIKSDRIVLMQQPKYQRKWNCDEIKNGIEKIRKWCEQKWRCEGDKTKVNGVLFIIGGDRQSGTDISPGISGNTNPKSSNALYETIGGKISSYRDICQCQKLPLAVVIYTDEEWVMASIECWSIAMTGADLQIDQQEVSAVCPGEAKPGSLFANKPLLSAAGWLELKSGGWHTIWLINPNAIYPFDPKLFSSGSEAG